MDLANSIVLLQPGLYILRHPKTGLPPISISRAAGKPEHNGQIQALYTPGTDGGVLRGGADAIVMQVLNAPVELLVTAYLEKAGATVPVIKIDKVGLDGSAPMAQSKAMEVPSKGISLIGHIERRGDVVATNGDTLGDPKSELRLEGFQIEWPDRPEGVNLQYSVRVEGGGVTPQASIGHFSGTRNAASRLLEAIFTLVGPKASAFKLHGKAHFSGGHSANIASGSPVSGPSGMEHLTALTLEIVPGNASKARQGPWEASARTRIFKSGKSSSSKAK